MSQASKQGNEGGYRENDTPAYVFDLDQLHRRVSAVRDGITRNKTKICFTVKANPFLAEALTGQVDLFGVCSPGEFHICECGKIAAEDIVVSGVYKAPLDVMRQIGEFEGRSTFTVESLAQMLVLDTCAKLYKRRIRVLLRLTSGDQFGMGADELKKCVSQRGEYENLEVAGIQYYSGTQKLELSQVEEELRMLDSFCRELEGRYGFTPEVLSYGPGLGVPYFEGDKEENFGQVLGTLNEALLGLQFPGTVVLEMGRFLAAWCGSYYTSVVDVKRHGGKNYCIVDGGSHHLAYEGQRQGAGIPRHTHLPQNLDPEAKEEPWEICGVLCSPSDRLASQMPMQDPRPGDLLVFERAGAYSATEGAAMSDSQDFPKVYLFSQETGMELIRERQGTCHFNMRREEEQEKGLEEE